MIKSINDINIYFNSNDMGGLIEDISIDVGDNDIKTSDLKLDIVLAYKKTPLILAVDMISSYISKKYDSVVINGINELVSFIIINALDPSFITSSRRALYMNKNIFREIEPYFKYDDYGVKFIDINGLSELYSDVKKEDVDQLFSTLESEGFIKKTGDKYYLDTFLVKSIKIGK